MEMYYLDNAATTRPRPEVVRMANQCFVEDFGNPSSVHPLGRKAFQQVDNARNILAELFKIPSEGIVFCGSGSESNNLAIKGVAQQTKIAAPNIVSSPLEHPSIGKTVTSLQPFGVETRLVKIDPSTGKVDINSLQELVDDNTILVSIQHANNETGIVQDIKSIGEAIKLRNAHTLFHVDAIQSFAKIPIRLKECRIDLLSLSAHKIHGLKGCGALVLGKRIALFPQVHGGGQESGRRSGTENVAGIAAFGKATSVAIRAMENNGHLVTEFSDWLMSRLIADIPEIRFLEFPDKLPHIISLSIPGIPGEVLLNHLAEKGIYVSTGSACHGSSKQLSTTLLALKLSRQTIVETLRLSFAALELPQDKEKLVQTFVQTVKEVQSFL